MGVLDAPSCVLANGVLLQTHTDLAKNNRASRAYNVANTSFMLLITTRTSSLSTPLPQMIHGLVAEGYSTYPGHAPSGPSPILVS